jgi:hypothetical protein
LSSFEISSFILPRKCYFRSPLRSGGITPPYAIVITATPRKRVEILLENRPNRGTDRLAQTILNRIAAQFFGQWRKYRRVGMMRYGVICLQVAAAGWGGE